MHKLIVFGVAVAIAMLWSVAASAADKETVFELKNGAAVVGVILHEGEEGFVVRKRDGETMRILYADIDRMSELAGAKQPAAAPAPPPAERRAGPPKESKALRAFKRKKSRYTLEMVGSHTSAGVAAGVFAGSFALIASGAVLSLAAGDETGGYIAAGAGIGLQFVSMGLLVGSSAHAKQAIDVWAPVRFDPSVHAMAGGGATMWVIGALGAVAIVLTSNYPFTPLPITLAVVGHLLWQGHGDILRRHAEAGLDQRELQAPQSRLAPRFSPFASPTLDGGLLAGVNAIW